MWCVHCIRPSRRSAATRLLFPRLDAAQVHSCASTPNHANLAAAAPPHNPGFQTIAFPSMQSFHLYNCYFYNWIGCIPIAALGLAAGAPPAMTASAGAQCPPRQRRSPRSAGTRFSFHLGCRVTCHVMLFLHSLVLADDASRTNVRSLQAAVMEYNVMMIIVL